MVLLLNGLPMRRYLWYFLQRGSAHVVLYAAMNVMHSYVGVIDTKRGNDGRGEVKSKRERYKSKSKRRKGEVR